MITSTGLGNEQLEIFYDDNAPYYSEPGYYYAFGQPGCLFDGNPIGPFNTELEEYNDAVDNFELETGEYNDHH